MNTLNGLALSNITEIGLGFTLEEAAQLINHEVMRAQDRHKPTTIESIGLISGLSTINDEVEVTITFIDHEEKATKSAFELNYFKVT